MNAVKVFVTKLVGSGKEWNLTGFVCISINLKSVCLRDTGKCLEVRHSETSLCQV